MTNFKAGDLIKIDKENLISGGIDNRFCLILEINATWRSLVDLYRVFDLQQSRVVFLKTREFNLVKVESNEREVCSTNEKGE